MIGKIIGTGSCLPEYVRKNQELEQMVDTTDQWIQSRTGILSRHISQGETVSWLAAKAAQRALQESAREGVTAGDLDLILVATMSGERIMPGIACMVHQQIQAKQAACMDLNAACSGFVYAYETAQAYIHSGLARNVLVIGAECLSRLVDWKDRSSCILFGDGAGAVVLQAVMEEEVSLPWQGNPLPRDQEEQKSQGCSGLSRLGVMHSQTDQWDALTCGSQNQGGQNQGSQNQGSQNYGSPDQGSQNQGGQSSPQEECLSPWIRMDGKAVFTFAVRKVPEVIMELLSHSGREGKEVQWLFLHQANDRIIQAVAKKLQLPLEQFPRNIADCGNTSSASIPILLDQWVREGKLQKGQLALMAGFGGGLSWGASWVIY